MKLALVALPLLLSACAQYPQHGYAAGPNQQRLAADLAVRVPGPSQPCISSFDQRGLHVVGHDIVYDAGRTIFVNHTGGGCEAGGSTGYTLVFDHFGGTNSELCRGTIVKVVDLTSGMFGGSCALGDFVPFNPR